MKALLFSIALVLLSFFANNKLHAQAVNVTLTVTPPKAKVKLDADEDLSAIRQRIFAGDR